MEASWHDFPKNLKNGTLLVHFWYTFAAKARYSLLLQDDYFFMNLLAPVRRISVTVVLDA